MTLTDTAMNETPHEPSADLIEDIEGLGQRMALVRERIGRVIFGQRAVVDLSLITLLSGGHALLIGVPGLAKTRLVETLGAVLTAQEVAALQRRSKAGRRRCRTSWPSTRVATLRRRQDGVG